MGKSIRFFMLLIMLFFLMGCGSTATLPTAPLVLSDEEIEPQKVSATLVAVGDIMVHDTQIAAAFNPVDKSYNFDESLLEVKGYLNSGNLTLGNLETTFAGEDLKYTSYPLFNTPESLAKTLKEMGFDILFTANNHSFDRKEIGVARTIEYLKKSGLEYVGTRQFSEESPILLKEVNGIKMAFLAYTYGLNGFKLPKDKEYLVNLINTDKIIADVQLIREQVDLVVCHLHFGVEYSTTPSEEQKKLVNTLLDSGVDIILGSHPHVLQEIYLNEERDKLVLYSTGNFVSSQKGLERQAAAIYRIHITKDLDKLKTDIFKVEYIPIYTQRYLENKKLKFKVLPIIDTLQNKPYPFLMEQDYAVLEMALKHVQSIMPSEVKVFVN